MAKRFDLDAYVSDLAAAEDTLSRAEAESFAEEHDAEIIQLTVPCPLCGYRCSPQTWDGFKAACPNCGQTNGRIPS